MMKTPFTQQTRMPDMKPLNMNRSIPVVVILLLFTFTVSAFSQTSATNDDRTWTAFRGNGSSLSGAAGLPTEWDDKKNIAWTTDLPGYGQSSPVIWDGRVFVTTMQGEMKNMPTLISVGLADGEIRWKKEYKGTQETKASDYVTRSSPTPAVDADSCYAFFESGDLIATDHDGNTKWQRSLVKEYGPFQGNHGIGSSIAINDTTVFVLVAHDGPSYLLGIDKKTGLNVFKTDLATKVSWSSPLVAGNQVILSVSGTVQSFDVTSGKLVWSIGDVKGNTVASATVHDDVVYIGSSERNQNFAIRFDPSGKTDKAEILWRNEEATSSFGSPLYRDGQVYYVTSKGVAYCLDASTGKTVWNQRLAGSSWASPVGTNEHVFFFAKEGITDVLIPGDKPELVSSNTLTVKDRIYGVAVADSRFVVRTGTRLIGISSSSEKTSTVTSTKIEEEELIIKDCPVAVTSFGAAICEGYLYVYGGNQADAHTYSAQGQNNQFRRVKLASGSQWESLGEVPRRQGNALVSYKGKVYRIGGFEAKNKLDTEDEKIVSSSDFAVYDPKASQWTELVPLPEPRSSFDAVVDGDILYVVGGWALSGDRDDSQWHGTAWQMDLSREKLEWKSMPAPAERRANSLAQQDGKIFLIGGMGEDASPTTTVLVFDPVTKQWSNGPDLPGELMDGFGSSSFNVGGRIVTSTFGGQILQLSKDGKSWENIGQLPIGRFFHRLVALNDSQFAVLGGTSPQSGKQSSVLVLDKKKQ